MKWMRHVEKYLGYMFSVLPLTKMIKLPLNLTHVANNYYSAARLAYGVVFT